MKIVVWSSVFAVVCAVAVAAQGRAPAVTAIRGQVVDLECSLAKRATPTDDHAACMMDCAKNGQPVAILTDDAVYVVEGDYTANKNAKLLDFVTRKVEAKGTIGEKDGKKTINVSAMQVLK